MKLFNSSNVQRIELLVPVLKDLGHLAASKGFRSSSASDPLLCLMESGDLSRVEARGTLLTMTESAIKAVESRVPDFRAALMDLDIQERLDMHLNDPKMGETGRSLQAWRDLCQNAEHAKPIVEDLSNILLHAPDAWDQLEASLRSVSTRLFVAQNVTTGRFEKDGTIDLSLMYTLLTNQRWNPSFPKPIRSSLEPFCQQEYFVTINGRPALYKL
jgi:hypothetical protein